MFLDVDTQKCFTFISVCSICEFSILKFLNCNTDDTVLVRVYSSSVKTTKNQDVSDGTRVLPTLISSSFKAFLIIIIK